MSNASRRQALGSLAAVGTALAMSPSAIQSATKRERIKIGQIGTAHGHATKLEVYRASDEYEVVGLVEPDPELCRIAQEKPAFAGVPLLTQEQLLNVPGLQAVLIETRIRDSLATAQTCVDAGLHVHVDKPPGESLTAFKRLLDSAAKRKRLVQMGYMWRFNPAIVLLRKFLERGWLGEVFEVHGVMSKVVDPVNRKAHGEYPGGIFFELACHLVDTLVTLLGKPQRVSSFAQKTGVVDDALIDNMLAVFEYPKAIATLKSSAVEVDGFARRHLVVCGTKGTFHIQPLDEPKAIVTLAEAQGEYRAGRQEIDFPKYTRYIADAADMAQIIRSEKASDWSAEHDLMVHAILFQACGIEPKP